jgi:hypothetical protein
MGEKREAKGGVDLNVLMEQLIPVAEASAGDCAARTVWSSGRKTKCRLGYTQAERSRYA